MVFFYNLIFESNGGCSLGTTASSRTLFTFALIDFLKYMCVLIDKSLFVSYVQNMRHTCETIGFFSLKRLKYICLNLLRLIEFCICLLKKNAN